MQYLQSAHAAIEYPILIRPHSICSICALEYTAPPALSDAEACDKAWYFLTSRIKLGQVKGFEFLCSFQFCAGCPRGCNDLHRHLLFISEQEGIPLWAVDHVLYWKRSELWYRMREASHEAWEKEVWEEKVKTIARKLEAKRKAKLKAAKAASNVEATAASTGRLNPVKEEVELYDQENSV